MVFSSLQFLFIFMPVFFGCYYFIRDEYKNIVLFAGSLCFYFVGTLNNPEHFILFVISIMVDFCTAVGIEKYQRFKKLIFISGVTFHVIILTTYKYLGFILSEVIKIAPNINNSFDLILPIGISFYTFQGISYIADVYKGTIKAEKSLLRYGVYISMFEQLIAGPIVTYRQVRKALKKRTVKTSSIINGLEIFVFGLGLKVLLANPIGKLWSQTCAIGFESISTPLAWLSIFAFTFQIYFDFFGYSLMAIGLGKMLGFRLPKNFDHPYTSKSMTEFWRRWHMTLGSWFREYIYIPLGGNRKGTKATIINMLIVWLFTGIWHGAGYNFLLWGLLLFAILLLEKFCIGKFLDKYPVIGHLYMLLLIPLSWAVFAIEDIEQLGIFISRLFPIFGQGVWSDFRYDYLKYLEQYYPFFIFGALFSIKLPYQLLKKISNRIIIWVILFVILIASAYCMFRGMDDPFLYFRF